MRDDRHIRTDWQALVACIAFIGFIVLVLVAWAIDARASAPPEILPMTGHTRGVPVIDSSLSAVEDGSGRPHDAQSSLTVVGRSNRHRARSARRPYTHADPPLADHEPATHDERLLIYRALSSCEKSRPQRLDVWLALRLLRVEADVGLPSSMRGLTLSVWCGENAWGSAIGDGGKAVGAFQMHPGSLWQWCGRPDRTDVTASAFCWLRRVKHLATGKALRWCGKRHAWRAAELWVSQGGLKSDYSCKLMSGHVARQERWQRLGRVKL